MKSALPKKFMSLREKNGSHRRSKSSEPGHKSNRPSSSEVFFSYFKSDAAKQAAREEEEKGKLEAKIDEISNRLEELNYRNVSKDHIRFTLQSRFAEGDVDKAIDFVKLQQQAFSGIVLPYDPNVVMVGAENRGNVTCYLDALLFAMFAKLQAFECMLKNDLPKESQRKLATLIRLWVNMLRSGKMIHTDMTEHLQGALAECGWSDASLLEQQDTSEAFAFITETLQLPLLTLQVDLFHQGKNDADDHKVVYERLLNLAVPPDPEGKGISLEDCLEDYFNTQVDVLRDRPEEKHSSRDHERPSLRIEDTIRLVPAEDDSSASASPTTAGDNEGRKSESFDKDPAPLQRRWTIVEPPTEFPSGDGASSSSADPRCTTASGRQRSASIIQRFVIEDRKPKISGPDSSQFMEQFKRQGSTIVKAITIPAWQFFRLIPWHSASASEPKNDVDVARQFNQRPVVGICLKRYMMNEAGQFIRQNTYIDIPDSLRLPHFMMGDDERLKESSELNAEYKLVLQSVVCHRGISLHSGHYVSFARVNPKVLTENRRCDNDPPPDYEEEQWVKFDDLAVENRVTYVEDIRQALKEDMPYLLFYQIVPMVDLSPSSTEDGVPEPPSYNDSTITVDGSQTQGQPDAESTEPERPAFRRQNTAPSNAGSSFVDPSTWGSSTTGPSIRFSSELDQPPRISFDEESNTSSSVVGTHRKGEPIYSRRGSLTFTEPGAESPAQTPEGGRSPVMSASVPSHPNEESAVQRLSRTASRWTTKSSSRSRPVSQAGEGRISLTMSRLGLTRPSKDPLRLSEEQETLAPVSAVTTPATAAGAAQNPLSAVVTAPAATPSTVDQSSQPSSQATLVPAETLAQTLRLPAEQAQVDDSRRHHHHPHMRRGKSKSRDKAKDADDDTVTDTTPTATSSGKGKEKEKSRNKMGVPERECTIM